VSYVKSDEVKGLTEKEVALGTRCDDKYTCPNFCIVEIVGSSVTRANM
jgi:hypothetical protein